MNKERKIEQARAIKKGKETEGCTFEPNIKPLDQRALAAARLPP